jgi:hypothetical protein
MIGEMCKVLQCGFPLYSEMSNAYPTLIPLENMNNMKGAHANDFATHFDGWKPIEDRLVRADGVIEYSGWYADYPLADECISLLTGCHAKDFSCHNRHAMQQLVRGFKPTFAALQEESKLIGVPANFKHGILTLPHIYAPRLDAAVHLRCMFKHFEWLVGTP